MTAIVQQDEAVEIKVTFEVVEKSAPAVAGAAADDHYIAGWAYCSEDVNGAPVIDISGDVIPVFELRKAMQRWLAESALSGDMHTEEAEGTSRAQEMLITSVDVQKAWAPSVQRAFRNAVTPALDGAGEAVTERVLKAIDGVDRYLETGAWVRIGVPAEVVQKVRTGSRLQFSMHGRARAREAATL